MDYYDSNYPLDYYSIGKKYFFYRDTTNRNYWLPQNKVEQDIYNSYVAKHLTAFKSTSAERSKTDIKGVTEAKTVSSIGVTETSSSINTNGVTEDKGSKSSSLAAKAQIEADKEGALINYIGINKEIGIVVGKYDGTTCQLLTVLFDDGKVLDYIVGRPSCFSQKNFAVRGPKLKVTVPPLKDKQVPLSLQKLESSDGQVSGIKSISKGVSGVTSKQHKPSITEVTTQETAKGITETGELGGKVGITESDGLNN